jgi:glucose/arabinose dehydrogenase
MSDWELPRGFSLKIDVEGFDYPTAVAFVPHPGSDPKSPLYFVTEIRGRIKVVTNDRTVYTFAENPFVFRPKEELPSIEAEAGTAGILLDPEHGYVFVSGAYHDARKVLRNNIVRFQTTPGVFGLKAEGPPLAFTDIFKEDISRLTHQIGAMLLHQGALFVGVADGGQHLKGASLDSTLGKVLRMSLDGKPLPDNPFYEDQEVTNPKNYVWAYGMRNPFGICMANGRLFTSENGIAIDRFYEIHRGQNIGWDGTDWSIGTNAPIVFGSNTVSPVHSTWLAADNPVFPEEYRARFYVALHGGQAYSAGVAMLDYDFPNSRMATRPKMFAFHATERTHRTQPVGLAFGPDALYVAALYPVRDAADAKGAILRMAYEPEKALARHLGPDEKVEALMAHKGCYGCHGRTPGELNVAPALDRETLVPRILTRIRSEEYRASIREIDTMTVEPFVTYRAARKEVLAADGMPQAGLWIKYHILEPRFDRTASAMPTLEVTDEEAGDIAAYLLRRNIGDIGVTGFFRSFLNPYLYGPATRRHLPGAFGMGFVAALGMMGAWHGFRWWRSRRRADSGSGPVV